MHPELENLLKQHGDLLDTDLSGYHVYGSAMRPMSASWARIEGAVFIQCDKRATGYHTYVAVPGQLDSEIVARYELRPVALGKDRMQ